MSAEDELARVIVDRIMSTPPSGEGPKPSDPDYAIWCEGFKHGQMRGWMDAKAVLVEHFTELMRW